MVTEDGVHVPKLVVEGLNQEVDLVLTLVQLMEVHLVLVHLLKTESVALPNALVRH